MESWKIVADPDKCTGCWLCAIRCSFAYTGLFNPLMARIKVLRPVTGPCEISFTEECNNCGLCVTSCKYGALEREKEES